MLNTYKGTIKSRNVDYPCTSHRNARSSSLWVIVPWTGRQVTACPHCTVPPPLVFNPPHIPKNNPSMHYYSTNRLNRKAQLITRHWNNAHSRSDDSSIEVTLLCHRLKLWLDHKHTYIDKENKNQGWEGSQLFITEKRNSSVLSLKTDSLFGPYN